MDVQPNHRGDRQHRVYLYAILASLLCFIMGYHLGVISGAMLVLVDTFDLDIVWQQLITTATIVGAAISLFPAGYLVQLFGRKKVILGANIILSVGAAITAAAPRKEVLVLGRFITGIGIGIPSLVVPMYMSECAPANIRGRLGSLTQVMLMAGVFLSAVMGGAFNSVQSGWRYMFAVPCIVGAVQLLGFLFAPETPRWLIHKGRKSEARTVLMRLRDNLDDVQTEIEDIQRTVTEAENREAHQSGILVQILKTGPVRRALVLATCMAVTTQMIGIGAVLFYSGTIMKMAGFESENAAWLTTLPTGLQLVSAFISLCFVEKLGRKVLFIGATIGVLVSLIILGLGFFLSSTYSPVVNTAIVETYNNGSAISECQFKTCQECISSEIMRCGFCYDVISNGTCLPVYNNRSAMVGRCLETNSAYMSDFKIETNFCPSLYSWITVLGLSLYLFTYSSGMGVIWIIISEVFPLWARSTCSSVATAMIWIFQIIVSMTFLSLTKAISSYGTFWLYGACALLSIIYTCIFMPETRGTNLEDMEMKFMTREEHDAHETNWPKFFTRPE